MNVKNTKIDKNRFKNIWFWLGIFGVIGATLGIDATTLTSWSILKDTIVEVLKNPYLLGSTILAVLGVFVNPTTKGLSDEKKKVEE